MVRMLAKAEMTGSLGKILPTSPHGEETLLSALRTVTVTILARGARRVEVQIILIKTDKTHRASGPQAGV